MITQSRLKELLHYDPQTGLFTRLVKTSSNVKVGEVAGWLNHDKYISISVENKHYRAHRLAFLYMNGEFPSQFIDHKNRVRHDNKWDNLREAEQSCNMLNSMAHSDNISGFKGVSKNCKKWEARAMIKGVLHRIGQFKTAEEASLAYKEFAIKHHGDFYCEI